MKIQTVILKTANVATLHKFYGDVLGLPCELSSLCLSIRIGATTLIYEQEATFTGFYHLAFEVPHNLVDDAQSWLQARVPLLADANGHERFGPSAHWNTTNLYFADPAGNILQLVARHGRNTAQDGPFTSGHILNVSEVGAVVDNVPIALSTLASAGLCPFNGQSDTFTAVGGHGSMLIVVPAGRGWFPTGRSAVPAPIQVELDGGRVTL
ncbi:VOC family protein [Deinococcus lacus]|uniref:VOC family protein n=1 Tax=Deinococcus lacus TaxID=392561 RepID=A0ABW1Y8X7_9DEIO